CTSALQDFEDSSAHRNEPPSFWSLAVWHEDHSVLPIQVLDAHPEELSFVPHSRIAHQDDDIAEKLTGSLSPLAGQSSRYEFLLCFVVESKMSSMLLHHFDFRSVTDHLPLLCFVQHSSQCSQCTVGVRGGARKS